MGDREATIRADPARGDIAARNGHRSQPAERRRRPVPGGRAVVGGLLVAASAVGLFSASTRAQSGPRQSFVVARHALAPGVRLQASDLQRLKLDLPDSLAQRAFRDARALVGATVVAPLAPGELVQSSAVVAKPSNSGSREVTFTVARAAVGAALETGERIDVVATYGGGADAFSALVLRQVLVVGLDGGRSRLGDGGDVSVTVAVDDPADALALAHAVQLGRLTVVRATGAPAAATPSPVYRQPGASSATKS